MVCINGNTFEGEFKEGKLDGKGKHFYKDKLKYDGYFRNAKYDGKGIYYHSNGNKYDGEFHDNLMDGLAFCIIKMEIDMKENSNMIKKMEKVKNFSKMVIYMRVILKMINLTEKVK